MALARRPRRVGGSQRGGGTRCHNNAPTDQQGSVMPAAIAGVRCSPLPSVQLACTVQKVYRAPTSYRPACSSSLRCTRCCVRRARGASRARNVPCSRSIYAVLST